jgi:hypothetical protein
VVRSMMIAVLKDRLLSGTSVIGGQGVVGKLALLLA